LLPTFVFFKTLKILILKLYMMKKLYFLALFLIALSGFSQATLPLYDGFDYTVGAKLRTQGSWILQNATTADSIYVAAGNLDYSGLAVSTGNKVTFAAIGNDDYLPFTSQTTGTVYYSLLLNVNSMAGVTDANGGYFAGFNQNLTTFGATLWTKRVDDSTYNIGLEVRTATTTNTTWTSTTYNTGTTYFIVVSYTFGSAASDDSVQLWVNPACGTTQPAATISDTHTGSDLTEILGFFLRQDSTGETPSLDIDELRVGTTWADVTPATPAGIQENQIDGFSMYPNPAKNVLNLYTQSNLSKNVQISDVLGKQLVNTTVEGTKMELNLQTGIYIIKVEESGKVATQKLVIE
jgi:hypothetical protein